MYLGVVIQVLHLEAFGSLPRTARYYMRYLLQPIQQTQYYSLKCGSRLLKKQSVAINI